MASSSIHNKNDDDFEATSTYVAVDVTTNDTSTTTTTTPHPVVNNEWFRSQCPDIPDEARGWTWDDSFYSNTNNEDIVAAFDIDRTIHDRPAIKELLKWFFWIPAFFILAVTLPVFLIDGWQSAVPFLITLSVIYVFIFLLKILLADIMRSSKQRWISLTHVAVGTRGLYIDLVDSPCSLNLMNRTRIAYDEIIKCKVVSQYNFFYGMMVHRIYIRTKDDWDCTGLLPDNIVDMIFGDPKHVLEGIKNPQKYVDIVNAMMVRHAHLTTTTPAMNTGMEVA